MSATRSSIPRPAAAPPARAGQRVSWSGRLDELVEFVFLTASAVVCWSTPPFNWWREAVEQGWILVKRCLVPTAISAFAFGYGAPGIEGGAVTAALGQIDRLGQLFSVASLREFVPWVTGMVVAGVAGTAITADLGARKVREELDALAVIGVDAVRSLVAPRILALTLLMPALNLMGLVLASLAGLLAELTFHGTVAGYLATFKAGFTSTDLLANLVKTLGFGFIIASICSFKGMRASGGSEGVGRAVNQAVVIAFIAVWVFNFAFNSTYQGIFPGAQDIR